MTDKRAELAQRVEALSGGVQAPKEWALLCEAVEALWEATPEEERPALLTDVRAQIGQRGWRGYHVGSAPRDWLERAAAGEQTPLAAVERWTLARQGDAERMALLPALLDSDAARGVADLHLYGNTHLMPDDVWAALCACPRLDSLRRLSVFDAQIGDAHIAALVAATGNIWDSLRALHLHNAPCTVVSAKLIAGFAPAGGLEVMDFGMGTKIGWEGRLALASSPTLSAAVRKAQNVGAVRVKRADDAEEGGGQRFGDVRSALQREPGPPAWCALTHALSGATAEDMAERLGTYAEAGLRSWPDAQRIAPEAWIDDALRGQEHPALALCRAVTIRGEHLNGTSYLNVKMADQLTSSRMWPHVRHLRIDRVELANKTLQNLLWAPEHPGLTSIDLCFAGTSAMQGAADVLQRAPQERLDQLSALSLDHINAYSTAAKPIAKLLADDKLPALDHLALTRCDLGDEISAARPLIARLGSLTVEVNELHIPALLDALSAARRLHTLRLAGTYNASAPLDAADGARLGAALAGCAATLHTLDLSGFATSAAGLAALCQAAALTHLTTLCLAIDASQPAAPLLDGVALPALHTLEIARAASTPQRAPLPLASWAQAPCWAQLARLKVRGLYIEDGMIRAAAAPLPSHLDLEVEPDGTTLLDELARRPELVTLRVDTQDQLSWRGPAVNAWPALTSLTLRYQDEGKHPPSWPGALADAAPNLRELWLTGAGIGDKGVAQLIESGLLPQLTGLGLSGCKIKQAGALKLVEQLGDMPQLSALSLAHGSFTLAVAQALAPLPTLAQLHRLDLRGNRMGFEGRQALVSSPHLPVMLWTTLF